MMSMTMRASVSHACAVRLPRHRHTASAKARGRVAAHAAAVKPWKANDCKLVLEDGSVWPGKAFGAKGTQVGEVVFNTSLSGYQEILTDPSYAGQFVLFTCPHIGNVGINLEDMESKQVHLGGILVRQEALNVSNYRSAMTLDAYLKEQGVIGISDIDTREITRRLRETGCLNGVLTTDMSVSDADLVAKAKGYDIVGKDLISEVTCSEPYEWKDTTGEWEFSAEAKANKEKFNVVVYDFGVKHNILRRLASFGCKLTIVPASYPADKVMAMNPDGILFSNGPGDPSAVPYAVENAKALLGKLPVFGICMGHQVLGQAFGGKTFKLKFGHHGGNHPVRGPSGAVEISSQNHNFAVDPKTLPSGVQVSHINLNDGTCAGMVWPEMKAMTIQYHPEASPGPHDSDVCFADFVNMMKAGK
mmetsp:Transcript_6398/g.23151  ORF Transcript_6398/g.23151 Transcript_6398/m.23151 type:complete len:417 (-) Transcript_6398:96-1346(-)